VQGAIFTVPQFAYVNNIRRNYTLTDLRRREMSECQTPGICPKHFSAFLAPCGQPVAFYLQNGVQEDFRQLLNGVLVAVHPDRAALFAAAHAAGLIAGFYPANGANAA
jgi:hypothetical protein